MTLIAETQSQHLLSDATAEALLSDLVAIPSPSTEETAAVAHLVAWMRTVGYDRAFQDEAGNAVGVIGTGTEQIILLGHIDTFGGNPPPRQEGRLLYGRGAVDAKGALCAFAVAARRARLRPDAQVIVVGAVEEECPTSKGARAILTRYTPSACIIGEPSGWERITLGYKGRLIVHWSYRSGLSHSAGPQATPAEEAIAYWRAVETKVASYNQGRAREFERLAATVQALNTHSDGVYSWAQMTLSFRLPPTLTPDELIAQLPTTEGILAYSGGESAYLAERDTHVSRALRSAIRSHGGTPAFVHKTGTSDMNIVGPHWGCPIVAYGPGDSALDHTPHEHIHLDEYLRAIAILTHALERL